TLEVTLWGQKQGWTLPETLDRIGKRLDPALPKKGSGSEQSSSVSQTEPELFGDETAGRGGVHERGPASAQFQLHAKQMDANGSIGIDLSRFPDEKPAWLPAAAYSCRQLQFVSALGWIERGGTPYPVNTLRRFFLHPALLQYWHGEKP